MDTTMEETSGLNSNIPQWKRDLILRRRAVGRVLPTGSGSVQLTCPSVVDAVRLAEYSVDSNFHRSCESERETTSVYKNMRLIEQVNTSNEFVEPCVVLGIKEIITKIESGSNVDSKMGEEKNGKKKFNSSLVCDKKSDVLNGFDDDNASDSSEEFKYGPGIVSKLKSKYLSLTLRESQSKVRPSLDSLRRAASLENILNSPEPEKFGEYKSNYLKNIQSNANGASTQRCRGLSRSNRESMKRARSVEVLTRHDKGNIVNSRRSLDNCLLDEENGGDRTKVRSRISSLSVEEKELPPPDHVKQTLRIFEKSQNIANNNGTVNSKKINPKKLLEPICAKKPLVSPRSFPPKQNGVEKANSNVLKNATELTKSSAIGFSVTKSSDKGENKVNENASENIQNSTSVSDLSGNVSRRKAAFLKENSCESVINTPSLSENNSKCTAQGDVNNEKNTFSNINLKSGLSLDLTDLAANTASISKASPGNVTSSKCTNERVVADLTEAKRSISPVLVRAPPSILSTELNSNNSSAQHMKQVGVIRPIVTNKVVQLNLAKQQLNKSHLTEREIEKNLINKVKCIEQPVTKVIVSLKKSPEECFVNETLQPKETVKKGQFWDQTPNTMIFNFSNRKTVPDYIENDGLILAPRREKPKRENGGERKLDVFVHGGDASCIHGIQEDKYKTWKSEPGIILLNGETKESSADFDPEEFTLEHPLPCDIIFEGDNILINGRSNIQTKPKLKKMKIQFNDEATTLFEYPSEASLLDDQENVKPETDVSPVGACSPELSIPFRCGNLANYTPSKVSLSTDFQLGITKTTPPFQSKFPKQESEGSEGMEKEEEDDEEGYLRPADDASTVTWNSETAADLLF